MQQIFCELAILKIVGKVKAVIDFNFVLLKKRYNIVSAINAFKDFVFPVLEVYKNIEIYLCTKVI